EADHSGNTVWKAEIPGFRRSAAGTIRLRNGNTIVAGEEWGRGSAIEIDRAGKRLWEVFFQENPDRVRNCMSLIRLGFQGPRPPVVDLNALSYCLDQLKDKNPLIRGRGLAKLQEHGPTIRPAIPALIDALDDPEETMRNSVQSVLRTIGPPV